MKLIINTANNLGGGGLQVALSFIEECRNFPDNQYYVFLGASSGKQLDRSKFSDNFTFYDIPTMKFYKLNSYLQKLENNIKPDVVFTVFGPSYYHSFAPQLIGYALPYYIYTELPFLGTLSFQERLIIKLKKLIHLWYFRRDANAIVCETKDATNRISKMLKGKREYYTVSNTCGRQYFENKNFAPKLPPQKEGEFRLLTLSKYYKHKNIQNIPFVIDKLLELGEKSITFVLTITDEEYNSIFADKYKTYVTNVGPVPAEQCPSLYQECDAMYLPTMIECFSASYPEAMAMNKPIITSDLPFARSICQDSALFFDPLDFTQVAKSITSLANNIELQRDLVAKSKKRLEELPTALQRAERYLEICKQLKNVQR